MTGVQVETAPWVGGLGSIADAIAARARAQELFRDRARPGTGVHHLHAHSATLWRQAESSLRARIEELELGSPG